MKFNIKKYLSPIFLVLLCLSAVMWYLTKLSYTYTAEVPVSVNIAGNRFTVMCEAEGVGYRILAHRMLNQSGLELDLKEVKTKRSAVTRGAYVVNPRSLQNIISARNSDIRIISIGEIPEITPQNP